MPEPDGAAAEPSQLDRHAQMPPVADPLHGVEGGRRREQHDARVAEAERLEPVELVGQLERGLGRSEDGVDALPALEVGVGEVLGRVLSQRREKASTRSALHREPGRHAVPAGSG